METIEEATARSIAEDKAKIEIALVEVKLLDPQPGNILVLGNIADDEVFEHLHRKLSAILHEDVWIVGLSPENYIKLLSPKDGDTLVFTGQFDVESWEATLSKVRGWYPEANIIFLDSGETLVTVDEETMRAQGWVRAPQG